MKKHNKVIHDSEDDDTRSSNHQQQVIVDESSNDSNGGQFVKQMKRLSIHNNQQLDESTSVLTFGSEKEKKRRYNTLIRTARDMEKNGQDPQDYLHMYKEAYSLYDFDDKLLAKIKKYSLFLLQREEQLRQHVTVQNNAPMATSTLPASYSTQTDKLNVTADQSLLNISLNTSKVEPTKKRFIKQANSFIYDTKTDTYILMDTRGKNERKIPFKIPADIYNKLYDYQKEGILWMWQKHSTITNGIQGGILGDDMGLGKTIQVVTFISGLFAGGSVKYVMIAMPVSLVENWRKEFTTWSSDDFNIFIFHSLAKKQREDVMKQYREEGGVLITTYGTIGSQIELFKSHFVNKGHQFDYIILDEGHKIKNPDIKLSKCLHQLPTAMCRYIISGTPVQNNLLEMHALLDWIFKGVLLGDRKTFREEFEKKIVRGNERDATSFEMKLGSEILRRFRELIGPHFLRREKSQVLKRATTGVTTGDDTVDGSMKNITIGRKNDLVVWVKSTDYQLQLYRDFLNSEDVSDVLNDSSSPLAAITILKQICCHPDLLPRSDSKSTNVQEMVAMSGKMIFLKMLIEQLQKEGERCLIFSQSSKMLDMIASMLRYIKVSYTRIDGTISDPRERQRRVDAFNEINSPYFCFLLTSQTGSVGLTLTAATRVVIFDPSWNPTSDNQAADRCYRIGQTKDVVIYRLISCSTIEEKVYRKQVFKEAIFRSTTETESQYRYFTQSELKELFSLPQDPNFSETQKQLEEIHQVSNNHYTDQLKRHLDIIKNKSKHITTGFSNHDLLYTKQAEDVNDGTMNQREISMMADDSARALIHSVPSESKETNINLTSPQKDKKKRKHGAPEKKTRGGASKDSEFTLVSLSDQQKNTSSGTDEESFLSQVNTTSLSNMQCKQLIKGVRLHGESGFWRRILESFSPKISLTPNQLENEWKNFKIGKTQNHLMQIITYFDSEFTVLPELPKIKPQSALLVDPKSGITKPPKATNQNVPTLNGGKKTPPKATLQTPPRKKVLPELSPSDSESDDAMFLSPINTKPVVASPMIPKRKSTATFDQIQRRLSSFFGLIDEDDENYEPSDAEEEEILNSVKAFEEGESREREVDQYAIKPSRKSLVASNIQFDEESDEDTELGINYDKEADDSMQVTPMNPKRHNKIIHDDEEDIDAPTQNGGNMEGSPMMQTPIVTSPARYANDDEDDATMMMSPTYGESNQQYISVLKEARRLELNGDLVAAMDMYLNALEISDSDIQLHCKLNHLAHRLEFFQ